LERFSELFNIVPEENLGCGEAVNHLSGEVGFQKVSFAYHPQEPVLEDISLQPDILVLDEPTSALDSLMEKTLFDAFPAWFQGKTLFVVAHRLTTVQDDDRILLLMKSGW